MHPIHSSLRPALTLLTTLALAATTTAQTPCHAEFDGDTFADNWLSGGPNYTNCIQTKAPAAMVALSVQVFTGEQTGSYGVGIWSYDATTGKPKAELAKGSFLMRKTNSWQGANLDKPVILQKDEVFFVSYIPVNGAQVPTEGNGRTLPGTQIYYWSPTNAAPWNGPYQGHQFKFRIWCQTLPPQGIDVIGAGCKDGNGALGFFDSTEKPTVGNASFKVEGTTLPPNQPAIFAVGLNPAFVSFDLTVAGAPGCFLHTDIQLEVGLRTTGTGGKSNGTVSIPLPIPNQPILKGTYLRSQLWVADPGLSASLKAVFTNGLAITVL